jgi:hypothetical protein
MEFQTRLDREVWEMRTQEIGIRGMADRLGLSFRQVRKIVLRLETERLQTQGKGGKVETKWEMQKLLERAHPSILVKLARLLTAARSTSRSTP